MYAHIARQVRATAVGQDKTSLHVHGYAHTQIHSQLLGGVLIGVGVWLKLEEETYEAIIDSEQVNQLYSIRKEISLQLHG